jgi:hypothetical protein
MAIRALAAVLLLAMSHAAVAQPQTATAQSDQLLKPKQLDALVAPQGNPFKREVNDRDYQVIGLTNFSSSTTQTPIRNLPRNICAFWPEKESSRSN